jgi:diacylglycerol kinase (ATP)
MESFKAKPGYQGLTRIIKVAGYSARGFCAAWTCVSAFRREVVLTGALILSAFWLGHDPVEIGMLVASLIACCNRRASQFRDRGSCQSNW